MSFINFSKSKDIKDIEQFLRRIEEELYKAPSPEMMINVSVRRIREGVYRLIECEACFGSVKVLCLVASSNLSRLSPLLKNFHDDQVVNILDYLPQLLPDNFGKIGLVTFQNGIQNSERHFKDRANLVFKNLPGKPLFIGLYNPTQGLKDFARQMPHVRFRFTETAIRTRVFIETLSAKLRAIVPKMYWLHVMHSEAGALGHLALEALSKEKTKRPTMMTAASGLMLPISSKLVNDAFERPKPGTLSKDEREHLKKKMITTAYGPMFPISSEFVHLALNTYSERDYVTGFFTALFTEEKGYEGIKIVPCLDEKILRASHSIKVTSLPDDPWKNSYDLIYYDHDFAGIRYRTALWEDIDGINDQYGFL